MTNFIVKKDSNGNPIYVGNSVTLCAGNTAIECTVIYDEEKACFLLAECDHPIVHRFEDIQCDLYLNTNEEVKPSFEQVPNGNIFETLNRVKNLAESLVNSKEVAELQALINENGELIKQACVTRGVPEQYLVGLGLCAETKYLFQSIDDVIEAMKEVTRLNNTLKAFIA